MLDIPKIYDNPILYRERLGTSIQPYRHIKESMTVTQNGYVLLTEVPDRYDKVKVTGLDREFHETEDEFLKENTFKVDYVNGWVFFHESLIGKILHFEYLGKGVFLFPDSRVYHTGEGSFPTVKDKFIDVDRAILVQKSRVDELIRSVPQPSEVVDMRVDYNGKIFRVAKDRIDAEQKKIEEAYFDAKGKKYDSLKLRIDALQLATEESFDEQHEENVSIWASIDLIPGKIELETGKLEEKINGDLALLESKIRLVPEQIQLKVQELREWTNGEFSSQSSTIDMLSNRIDLKVDVDGVTAAINLSKEGVRIQGDKIHLDGNAIIDKGVIKSAMIEDLDASKIKAGILRSQNNNTTWNLNTGDFTMNNANFEFSGGGMIRFLDTKNKIVYTQKDPKTGDNYTSGFGVGTNLAGGARFPFAYLGSARGNTLSVGNDNYFRGFITNTDGRTTADNIGNSVIGDVFHIRDKASGDFKEGFRFDLRDSVVNTMRPINADQYNYDIGTPNSRFRNVYSANVRSNSSVNIRDSHKTSGWMIQTRYANDGTAITLRGLNGGSYNYAIGASSSSRRIRNIFLRNKPNVSSDSRLKKDFADLNLGLDFIVDLKPKEFRFKRTKADIKENKLEFGFVAQDVRDNLLSKGVDINTHSLLGRDEDGYYSLEHEQFIAPIVVSIQELNDKDQDKDRRIKRLEEEVKELKQKLKENVVE